MPLMPITVLLPMRLGNDEDDPLIPLQIDTVASNDRAAISAAKVLAETHCQLEFHARPSSLITERAVITHHETLVGGAYAYCFSRGDRVTSLQFASACQGQTAVEMAQSLIGIQSHWCHGLVFDCAQLVALDSTALSSLVNVCRQVPCHFCRMNEPLKLMIRKIGLDKHLPIHDNISLALKSMVQASLRMQITTAHFKKKKRG